MRSAARCWALTPWSSRCRCGLLPEHTEQRTHSNGASADRHRIGDRSPSDSTESGTATPTPPPTLATLAATDCLTGPYRLVRFAQLGGTQTYGTGQGGDVDVTFAGKDYTLRGGGTDPIALTLAGQTADLTIDGTAKGTFDLKGDRATFTLAGTKG